jgi:hypothetical protein
MGSVPVIDVDEEPTLTLADVDADTGKYRNPADDSETGQGYFHATGEEFLECLKSGHTRSRRGRTAHLLCRRLKAVSIPARHLRPYAEN